MAAPAGDKLARVIADIVGDAIVKASAATADGHHATRIAHTTALMEHMEGDLAPLCREAFAEIAEHPDTPPELASFYRATYDPAHQTDLILQILALFGLGLAAPFAAAAGKLQAIKNMSMEQQLSTPIPSETAAVLAARNIFGEDQGAQEARYQGMAGTRFSWLVDGAQHSPDIGSLLTMLQRGIIGDGQLRSGLFDGAVRERWHDAVAQLAWRPIDSGTAVAAAVESHIDVGQLAGILKANGVDPSYAELWLETAGRPPGVIELAALVNRGEMSIGDWQQAIRESDIKNKYIDALTALRHHYPPQRSIVAMLAAGAIDQETAARWMAYDGLHPDAIGAMVTEAVNRKHEKVRDFTQAQVLALYGDLEIDQAAAAQHLSALGYDQTEVSLLLAHVDHDREHRLQVEAVRKVQRYVLARLVDDAGARDMLRTIGIDGAQADLLLRYWSLERDQTVATLTPAQVSAAAKAGLIDETEFRHRIGAHGYPEKDIDLLWSLATGLQPGQAVQ